MKQTSDHVRYIRRDPGPFITKEPKRLEGGWKGLDEKYPYDPRILTCPTFQQKLRFLFGPPHFGCRFLESKSREGIDMIGQ